MYESLFFIFYLFLTTTMVFGLKISLLCLASFIFEYVYKASFSRLLAPRSRAVDCF